MKLSISKLALLISLGSLLSGIQNVNADEAKNEILIARSGCCSSHGGVCGCDAGTDTIMCCDGTASPSCTCSGY